MHRKFANACFRSTLPYPSGRNNCAAQPQRLRPLTEHPKHPTKPSLKSPFRRTRKSARQRCPNYTQACTTVFTNEPSLCINFPRESRYWNPSPQPTFEKLFRQKKKETKKKWKHAEDPDSSEYCSHLSGEILSRWLQKRQTPSPERIGLAFHTFLTDRPGQLWQLRY